ncbi:MAG: VIT domain-containing protein [Myxococcota bacterium]
MSFAPRPAAPSPAYESTGGRLVTADGRALPLIGAALVADARGGLVRVTLEQTFRNPHDEPLKVTYSLPLPADGAVSGFAFRIGDERVVGQVDTKQRARQRFEDAVLEGRTAALLDQERSSLFTQEVGNVPPRTQVVCEVQIDQKLAWLPDGAWEWRFPTVVAPRYLGAPGRVADHARVTVDVADGELPVKLALSLAIRDALADGGRPESPSHPLHSARGTGRTDVTFGDERGVALDRDVVVRWRVASLKVGTELDVSRPGAGPSSSAAYGLLTLVPPAVEARMTPVARDLIVLLDTSGSMSGSPLDQARRVTMALVDSLTDRDQLELIEFSSSPRRWKRGAVPATEANRRDAQAWLSRLRASGGTEMRTGILEALAPLRDESQRQVVLITDGLIGFESEVLEAISRRLPRGSRVHTVGVGSGVNRSLTMPAARAGRGVELVIGLGEDVEPFVKRLLARTTAPLLTDVELSGSALLEVAPRRVPDLYGGSPALVSLKLRPEGGELVVRSRSADGDLEDRLQVTPMTHGEGSAAVTALFAREAVEDLELAIATGEERASAERAIERLGLDFQISTRLTSWVAVSTKVTVDPRAPKRTETMPHALAYGLSAEGVGLRRAEAAPAMAPGAMSMKELARGGAARTRASGSAPPPMKGALDDAEGFAFGEEREEEAGFEEPALDKAPPPAAAKRSPARPAAPAQKAAPEPKRREGLMDFARRLLTGKSEERPAAAEVQKRADAPAPTRRLHGKVRRQGKRLIIEIDVTAPLQWSPANEARLELSDGTIVKAPVELALTTADGMIALGLVVTLVLELAESVGEPATVHLSNGAEVLEIVL